MSEAKKPPRFRFSLKALVTFIAILAFTFSSWIVYSKYRIQRLIELRQQGAIVIIRNQTPQAFQAVGLGHLSPFYDVPTVELYVTPSGDTAKLGNVEAPVPKTDAEKAILEQASIARSYGAKDVQLIMIDSFDPGWMGFAEDNGLSSIGDSKERYLKRLKANQETGANINP